MRKSATKLFAVAIFLDIALLQQNISAVSVAVLVLLYYF